MPVTKKWVPLRGSERPRRAAAAQLQEAELSERSYVTVLINRRTDVNNSDEVIDEILSHPPWLRRSVTRDEFEESFGADPRDLEKIHDFANEHDLDVVEESLGERRVVLAGAVRDLFKAFNVANVEKYQRASRTYRQRSGCVSVPDYIAPVVQAVLGLDNRPQARPHFRTFNARASIGGSVTPHQVADQYNFPADTDGSGQCVALIELGGGYEPEDLDRYFSQLGFPTPSVQPILVDNARNQLSSCALHNAEVALDIQIVGAVAPRARILVYLAPNTDNGFMDAVKKAIHPHNPADTPSVISISWGDSESRFTGQTMRSMNDAFRDAALLGITVCCASGDRGSSGLGPEFCCGQADALGRGVGLESERVRLQKCMHACGCSPESLVLPDDNRLHVDFPASSPFALACGGTQLQGLFGWYGNVSNEVVWNGAGGASGGGISDVFDAPKYQDAIALSSVDPGSNARKGRGVPDVAGHADPAAGYWSFLGGRWAVGAGGTSVVAPLWAGLIARLNQKLGYNLGYLNPVLYELKGAGLRDIVAGNNDLTGRGGPYSATEGWDPCTGWGSPNGIVLLELLNRAAASIQR